MGVMEGSTRWFARARRCLLAGCVVTGVVVGSNIGTVQAATAPPFIAAWGGAGDDTGRFNDATGLATDSDGNIYVVDSLNDRVQKFSPSGAFLLSWGGGGAANGQFTIPYGIAISPNDDVYVVDTGNYRIQRFTTNGAYVGKWGTSSAVVGNVPGKFGLPYDVAVDSVGNVYVSDAASPKSNIQKFSASGVFINAWGTKGTSDGTFNTPAGLAIDSDDNVYVVDSENDRVQKFTSTGAFLRKWGTTGTSTSQFNNPLDVAVDLNGNVYVVDASNHRIQSFTPSGAFRFQFGTLGSGSGQFAVPNGITADEHGNVFVVDSGNDRVQRFGDTTRPTITISRPLAGSVIPRGKALKASYSCNDGDGGSGLYLCTGPVASGALLDTLSVGPHTFTVTAVDRSGNVRSNSYPYRIAYARPDAIAQVGPNGPRRGNDTYGAAGAQTRTATAARGTNAVFYVTLQNDARFPDRLRVTGQGSTSTLDVTYRDAYGRDITGKVTSGSLRTVKLAPGSTTVLRVEVTVRAGAPHGSSTRRIVTVRSTTHAAREDAVGLTTHVS